jgi:hypothetical protein
MCRMGVVVKLLSQCVCLVHISADHCERFAPIHLPCTNTSCIGVNRAHMHTQTHTLARAHTHTHTHTVVRA